MPKRILYHGHRLGDLELNDQGLLDWVISTTSGVEVLRSEDGKVTPLNPRTHIRQHTDGEFNWGYGGSGPAQLALAICCDVLGEETGSNPRVYQAFKWRFVAKWNAEWVLDRLDVLDFFIGLNLDNQPGLFDPVV